jgi:hypothetical protein
MNKDAILGALPNLSQPDLVAIHAMSGQLIKATGAVLSEPGSLAAQLFEALSGAVNVTMPLSNLTGTTTGKTFEKHLPAVGKFLDAHFKGWDSNRLIQTAFLRMLMGLLRDDLKERGVTPSLGIMVTNLGRFPEVFDAAYPDYLAAGMGQMVLRHFEKIHMPPKTPVARKKARRI